MPANFPSAPTKMLWLWLFLSFIAHLNVALAHVNGGDQPLAKINILKTIAVFRESASISAQPLFLGLKGEDTQWITVNFMNPMPTLDDWVGVFSPAKFDPSTCPPMNDKKEQLPYICSAPIKYKYANESGSDYTKTGTGSLRFQLINQRADFSFALFSGGLSDVNSCLLSLHAHLSPILVAISTPISFVNPKAPLYPRLALGKSWNEMTVTWTSGYDIDEATPFVQWGRKGGLQVKSPAGTLSFKRNSMCGSPARTVGWRDPGFTHTSFLKDLWPNVVYTYRMGHSLFNGSVIWSKTYSFTSSPYPGQNSLQRVIVFGDMGKAERDGSNEYSDYQPGALNTTDQLIRDLDNIDIVFHIGDLSYSNGYVSQWDQFTAQVEPIASTVPYMIASGNHERDWPNSGSFYNTPDSGGECGVPAETMFYYPAQNKAKFWYSTDYGLFHFCIADSEHDWREGSEQYKFIEQCLASADRHRQPWLIFAAHRVLGYILLTPGMARRVHTKSLWAGRVCRNFGRSTRSTSLSTAMSITMKDHNHCMSKERNHYSGVVNGTIHVVVGGGGSHLTKFSQLIPYWSVYRDYDWGFVKLTAFNQSSLLFEYKKSRDGKVYDSFTISRDYRDVLACVHDSCEPTTLAT
ncbi:putative inactive purple acid phosphatase 27 [Hibiscus syriacus]|uniref:Purple acid phosphatase n=1 Tax=Hibiscus syriacus TaxID=106335 RepID=A0A6A3APM5_HIBSY|nr:putative inactive purple acid phosphatase 27 [Hibiscus syriacus]